MPSPSPSRYAAFEPKKVNMTTIEKGLDYFWDRGVQHFGILDAETRYLQGQGHVTEIFKFLQVCQSLILRVMSKSYDFGYFFSGDVDAFILGRGAKHTSHMSNMRPNVLHGMHNMFFLLKRMEQIKPRCSLLE